MPLLEVVGLPEHTSKVRPEKCHSHHLASDKKLVTTNRPLLWPTNSMSRQFEEVLTLPIIIIRRNAIYSRTWTSRRSWSEVALGSRHQFLDILYISFRNWSRLMRSLQDAHLLFWLPRYDSAR